MLAAKFIRQNFKREGGVHPVRGRFCSFEIMSFLPFLEQNTAFPPFEWYFVRPSIVCNDVKSAETSASQRLHLRLLVIHGWKSIKSYYIRIRTTLCSAVIIYGHNMWPCTRLTFASIVFLSHVCARRESQYGHRPGEWDPPNT